MNDLKSFIEDKIKAAQQELHGLDDLIAKRAGPLLEKKKTVNNAIKLHQTTLREYEKLNKPPKA